MSEPTLSERVAVEVMQWDGTTYPGEWFKPDRTSVTVESWCPEHDLAQAFEALEHFTPYWEVRHDGEQGFRCVIWRDAEDENDSVAMDPSLQRAICLALLAAVEAPK